MENQKDNMKKEGFGADCWIIGHRCYRCKHKWIPREKEPPQICPKCKSPYWRKPKTRFTKNDKKGAKKKK